VAYLSNARFYAVLAGEAVCVSESQRDSKRQARKATAVLQRGVTLSTLIEASPRATGGGFLIDSCSASEIFTSEDITDTHRQIARLTAALAKRQIELARNQGGKNEFLAARDLIQQVCAIVLTAGGNPSEYSDWNRDEIIWTVIGEQIGALNDLSMNLAAHVDCGTLPLVYFGNREQKGKYLPQLATAKWIAAFALSEAQAGSDAMRISSRAQLSADNKMWILNGEKQWVTNGGFADVYIVFARVEDRGLTAFIVERTSDGLRVGADEKLMGMQGCSVCTITMQDCLVPRENLLGEPGRGHVIALNTLNLSRVRLAARLMGAGRNALIEAVTYAKMRKAFGKSLADFGMIQQKIANIAVGIYTGEAMVYRTAGMINQALSSLDIQAADPSSHTASAIEEYAVECSIVKVWLSKLLDFITGETLQIFGGAGLKEDHPAAQAYRSSPASRIVMGTNEVNRLLITGWLRKRSAAGQLDLLPVIKKVTDGLFDSHEDDLPVGTLANECQLVNNAKKAGLILAGIASQRFMMNLPDHQEIVGAIADLIIEIYAMDTVLLRTKKLIDEVGEERAQLAKAMAQVSLRYSFGRIERMACELLPAITEDVMLRHISPALHRLFECLPCRTIALRKQIASTIIENGSFVVY